MEHALAEKQHSDFFLSVVSYGNTVTRGGCFRPTGMALRIASCGVHQDVPMMKPTRVPGSRIVPRMISLELEEASGPFFKIEPGSSMIRCTFQIGDIPPECRLAEGVAVSEIRALLDATVAKLAAKERGKVGEFSGWLSDHLDRAGFRMLRVAVTASCPTKPVILLGKVTDDELGFRPLGLFNYEHEARAVRFLQKRDGTRRGYISSDLNDLCRQLTQANGDAAAIFTARGLDGLFARIALHVLKNA